MSRFVQIPDIPDDVPPGLSPILQAMKQNLDALAGLTGIDKMARAVKYGEVQVADIELKPATQSKTIITEFAPIALSGTSHDSPVFPSGTRRIVVSWDDLSTNGTSVPIIQLGDAGGIEPTGYLGSAAQIGSGVSGANFTTGFGLQGTWAAVEVNHGSMTLTLLDPATNKWVASLAGGKSSAAFVVCGGGRKSLTGELTQIRITTVGGTDAFNGGSVGLISVGSVSEEVDKTNLGELVRLHNYLAAQLRGEEVGT